MRRFVFAALFAVLPVSGAVFAAQAPGALSSEALQPLERLQDGRIILAQSGEWQAKSVKRPRPQARPAYAPGARPGYRPRPGYAPGYRPGYRPPPPGYRPGGYYPGYRPGYRPAYGWRPPYPGWRSGWAPAPWYGSYWRPGYGWATAAGLVAVGVLAASAATAYSVPPPPNPAYCWFYTDQTYQTGYWAPCPPAP